MYSNSLFITVSVSSHCDVISSDYDVLCVSGKVVCIIKNIKLLNYITGCDKSNTKTWNDYFMAPIILLKIVQNL